MCENVVLPNQLLRYPKNRPFRKKELFERVNTEGFMGIVSSSEVELWPCVPNLSICQGQTQVILGWEENSTLLE